MDVALDLEDRFSRRSNVPPASFRVAGIAMLNPLLILGRALTLWRMPSELRIR
jgi:hypothetical protein